MKLTEILTEQAEKLYPLNENAECHVAFMQGAKWADKDRVEKACQWLKENIDKDLVIYNNQSWIKRDVFIDKLKKAMEE